MKLLYGVQGTGNGHISRARAIAAALKKHPEVEVTWLFSGRPKDQFFDMDIFGAYEWREGLTFITRNGKIHNIETLLAASPITFIHDIRQLDLNSYDLIATDYEPVTAWAARLQKRDAIGIGHQYAFNYPVPLAGENYLTKKIMQWFAPVSLSLGLHWHHFGHPILPPIAEVHRPSKAPIENQVLVYVPFENNRSVIELLTPLTQYDFYVYSPGLPDSDNAHIHTRKPSREGFQTTLANSSYVISNCGFELISEAIMLGKRILTKPVLGQMEQQSNAQALQELGLASVSYHLDTDTIKNWLAQKETPAAIHYPNVPAAICDWLVDNSRPDAQVLSDQLWQSTNFIARA